MLAAGCPKLQNALYSLRQECGEVLALKELSVSGFRTILEFLYTGTLKLDIVHIHEVLTAAQFLEIRQVEKACLDYQYYKGVGTANLNGGTDSTVSVAPSSATSLPLAPAETVTPSTLSDGPGFRGGATLQMGGPPGLYHAPTGVTPPPAPVPPSEALPPTSTQPPPVQPTGVTSSLGFDTNYIEDYLKLIESLQGTSEAHQGAALSSSVTSRYTTCRDMPRPPTQITDTRFVSPSQQPLTSPVGSSTPKPLSFPTTSGQGTPYSAEDMRKTILSVLSQERFEDEEQPPPPPTEVTVDKYGGNSSSDPNGNIGCGTNDHGSKQEVDVGPPTLTPEPTCILPSIINIVPHHRRKPPELTEAIPSSQLTQSIPNQAPSSIHSDVSTHQTVESDSELDNNDEGMIQDESDSEQAPECLVTQSQTEIQSITEKDIRIKIKLKDIDLKKVKLESPASSKDSDSQEKVQERPKGSKRQQKRKKKIPVKLNRQETMDSDEEESSRIHVKEESDETPSSGTVRRRGRPRKDQTKPLKKRSSAGSPGGRRVTCDQCGRVFGKQELLDKHMEMHQNALLFACHVCGMKYARPAELTRHQRAHSDETYRCDECSSEFADPRDFKKHMELHGIEKPFFCTYPSCGFRSGKPSIVEKHAVIHSGIKMHPCNQCGKLFAQPSGLRSHLRSCLQQRAYLCDFCGSSFNHLQSLKSHRMLHTGEKPYWCHDCGARFTDHRNFKRHRRIHDGAFPYPCTHCDKSFRHSNSLKAHLKTHGIHANNIEEYNTESKLSVNSGEGIEDNNTDDDERGHLEGQTPPLERRPENEGKGRGRQEAMGSARGYRGQDATVVSSDVLVEGQGQTKGQGHAIESALSPGIRRTDICIN